VFVIRLLTNSHMVLSIFFFTDRQLLSNHKVELIERNPLVSSLISFF
jgi:hypothetical protein